MIYILNKRLRNLRHQGAKDDIISSQILGLVLKKPMEKVWKDYEQHLYPYLSKTKLITLIDEGIKQIHNTNISNAIHAFNAFVSGTLAFPEREDKKEPWHTELNQKLQNY